MLTILILVDQGNSERTVMLPLERLPGPGDVLDLPAGGSCTVLRVDQFARDRASGDAFATATLNR